MIGSYLCQESTAHDLTTQIPDAKIFFERAKLRKEKEELEGDPTWTQRRYWRESEHKFRLRRAKIWQLAKKDVELKKKEN